MQNIKRDTLHGTCFQFDDNFNAVIDQKSHQRNEYLDMVDRAFVTDYGWAIGPAQRRALFETAIFTIFRYKGQVSGGFVVDGQENPEGRLHTLLRSHQDMPPLELIRQHTPIGYPTLLILNDSVKNKYVPFIRAVMIAILRLLKMDFAIIAPALSPRRLDKLYKYHGFDAISPPAFAERYKTTISGTQPNCVLMLRPLRPGLEISPALLAYGDVFRRDYWPQVQRQRDLTKPSEFRNMPLASSTAECLQAPMLRIRGGFR
ncbi:hypothetical protein [Roseibium sp. RKSG952]|uniref:hypothetical protein n=1 Tax=Roseibium sp. RKSG952 TaxID=2529384 RepID=UPI0012BCEA81|nr:hypothetical protein [Roseibium sp. RKSG952]MTH95333.1 hypothetical protein [Roseibium sp. RKSG952]